MLVGRRLSRQQLPPNKTSNNCGLWGSSCDPTPPTKRQQQKRKKKAPSPQKEEEAAKRKYGQEEETESPTAAGSPSSHRPVCRTGRYRSIGSIGPSASPAEREEITSREEMPSEALELRKLYAEDARDLDGWRAHRKQSSPEAAIFGGS